MNKYIISKPNIAILPSIRPFGKTQNLVIKPFLFLVEKKKEQLFFCPLNTAQF